MVERGSGTAVSVIGIDAGELYGVE